MYSYWNWVELRALSMSSASWSPSSYLFSGPMFSERLDRRGFPGVDEEGARAWRRLSAGLNAHKGLPPLLLQTSDREENETVPTWVQLRRADAPVEWYEYPNEGHVKQSPANKWWVFE